MSFLAPWLLLGGLSVAVPLGLHFFYKPRPRRLPWAAMRFLRQAIEQTSRRLKFQEYVLLALRCLALLLLALALARPTGTAAGGPGRGEGVDAVLVIDTSMSMAAADGEVSRLDRARAAALAVIDHLPANSTVQVVGCADRATLLGPRTPANLDQARRLVEAVEPTSVRGDILPGLVEAEATLDRLAGVNKEVYVFSDLQKSGWEPQAAAVRGRAEELRKRAALVVVRCGGPDRPLTNVAVADLTYPGGIPHAGSRVPVSVVVRNTGAAAAKNLTVTLEVEGRAGEAESGSLDELGPGQSAPVTLTARLDRPGLQLLTAAVRADDLPGDNTLERLAFVADTVRVLVVDGAADAADGRRSASHFVTNALVPVADDRRAGYHVRLTAVRAAEAGAGLLETHDVCVLCNVAASPGDRPGVEGLGGDFVARLGRFVREGGGLVIGGGPNVTPAGYNAAFAAGPQPLLPFPLIAAVAAAGSEPFQPAPDTTAADSFLARFAAEPYRTATAAVDIDQFLAVDESSPAGSGGGGRVLMRLTDGRPWLADRAAGAGRVVFVGTTLDTTWTNWPARAGSYLSFLQVTLTHLVGRAADRANVTAGDPIAWAAADRDLAYDLVLPDRTRQPAGKPTPDASGQPLIVTKPVTAAGVYRLAPAGGGLAGVNGVFAVAPDLRETADLASLSDVEAAELLGFAPTLVLAGPGAADDLATERGRREWTVWGLMALLAVAVAESAWAWFCGKAWVTR